jgi:aryl-alcohol dehydrogenase-like predicted oxidoreductase
VNGSLQRLQLDYLDLVYCAPLPASLPLPEMIQQLDALTKTGKLRHWRVLNWPLEKVKEAHALAAREGWSGTSAAQLPYSLLAVSPVEDEPARASFSSAGIGIVASYCLHGGLLTGKYQQTEAAMRRRFSAQQVEELAQKGPVQEG